MKVGDTVIINDQTAEITGFFDHGPNSPKWATIRWHEKQSDGQQFAAIRLDAFEAEKVEPS